MRPSTGGRVALAEAARIAIVGGGPAGSFFAILAARRARAMGRTVHLLIFEKKGANRYCPSAAADGLREGCNYCAGGISPRLADVLRSAGLDLPDRVVAGRAESITVHGDWKSVELPIPPGRTMLSVFRGSRPRNRADRHVNLDSYLLDMAAGEGAQVITGQVTDVSYAPSGRAVIRYRGTEDREDSAEAIEVDFVTCAGGVNQSLGEELGLTALQHSLGRALPGFRPPKVRKTLICELQAEEGGLRHMRGEVHFAQFGSRELQIEMSSIIPKGRWMTVVLVGRSVDHAGPSEHLALVKRFLELPHIKRLLPQGSTLTPGCVCCPNMTVGGARKPYGDRVALIGDAAVSRLYKDGIYSAYLTASALVDCVFDAGVDRTSLERMYWPAVRALGRDNRYGTAVFLLNRLTFSRRILSRIFYQAVMTERKARPESRRRLAGLVWKIASGDDSYRRILEAMLHPAVVWAIFAGGLLVTARNWIAEALLGLGWDGVGRYPTGVPREEVEKKRLEMGGILAASQGRRQDFERMFSIKIRASDRRVFQLLEEFGEPECRYLNPRLVKVRRTAGTANAPGTVIRYDLVPSALSFNVVLEGVVGTRDLLYRVRDGFAQGGVLTFSIDAKMADLCVLTIYVAFDFRGGGGLIGNWGWRLFAWGFPAFLHDVVWNNALCRLKHAAESAENSAVPRQRATTV